MSRTSVNFTKNALPILIVLILCAGVFWYWEARVHTLGMDQNGGLPTETIIVSGIPVVAEVASTEAEREQGLSNRSELPEGRGMLFVFPQDGIDDKGIWMKDMNFPLDILWMSQDGTIVTIYQNVATSTYAENPPKVFYPSATARYVLEVPAGFAAAGDIEVGATVVLP